MTPAELMTRLESHYGFECEGGPLRNCVEWHQLKAHVSTLQSAPPAGAQGETRLQKSFNTIRAFESLRSTCAQQAEEIARLRGLLAEAGTALERSTPRSGETDAHLTTLDRVRAEATR